MSSIQLKDVNLIFQTKREKRIKDILIPGSNKFDETCQGTMPVVFGIINKANNFEEPIRYAVAVGGDSDTIGAIVGSIAEAIWGIPEAISQKALEYLPTSMVNVIEYFYKTLNDKQNG